jgi:TfoX/Sxy family transcriptional regulator of competence genes
MAYNEKLAARIRQALAHLPGVEEKKMFGGIAFMVNGKMCLTAGEGRMMCRIDPALHEEAVGRRGSTVIMGGRKYKGYVHVSEELIRPASAFKYWLALALDFNSRAGSSRKKQP